MKTISVAQVSAACLCGLALLTAPARAGVNGAVWEFDTLARELANESMVSDATDALPFGQTTVVHEGMTMSKSEYLIESLNTAIDFGFRFSHMPSYYRGLALSNGFIEFTVNEQETFSITGAYDIVGVGTSSLFVQLVELGETETVLFESSQINRFAPDVELVVGGTSGDRFNYLLGSASGELAPGNYAFRYSFSRRHDLMDYLPGTGEGALRLTVTPEPATFGMLVLGAMAAAARRNRRR